LTEVKGEKATWLMGPHILLEYQRVGSNETQLRRLINGNVLVWEENGITYRLQTNDVSMTEAVKVAESLKALPGEPDPTPGPNLDGQMSLEEAQQQIGSRLLLPGYPADLGRPSGVFVQYLHRGPVVVSIWMEPAQPEQVRMVLYRLSSPGFDRGGGRGTATVQEVTVSGRPATWSTSVEPLGLRDNWGRETAGLLVPGAGVLTWQTEEGATYRLESRLSREEAIKVAESLR
jgi:hypothetical protein